VQLYYVGGNQMANHQMEEKQLDRLLNQIKQGDQVAFQELYTFYQPFVFYYSCKILGNREDAQDVVQETFTDVFNKITTLRSHEKFFPWLSKIAYSHCMMIIRKNQQVYRLVDRAKESDLYNQEVYLPDELSMKEMQDLVHEVIDELAPSQRMVVVFHYLYNMKVKEIAEIGEMKPNAVKVTLFKARQSLANKLSKRNINTLQDVKAYGIAPIIAFALNIDQLSLASVFNTNVTASVLGTAATGTILAEATVASTAGVGSAAKTSTSILKSSGTAVKVIAATVSIGVIGVATYYLVSDNTKTEPPSNVSQPGPESPSTTTGPDDQPEPDENKGTESNNGEESGDDLSQTESPSGNNLEELPLVYEVLEDMIGVQDAAILRQLTLQSTDHHEQLKRIIQTHGLISVGTSARGIGEYQLYMLEEGRKRLTIVEWASNSEWRMKYLFESDQIVRLKPEDVYDFMR